MRYLWGYGSCIGGLILLRRLKKIAADRPTSTSEHSRQRVFCVEIAVGLLLPLLQIPLHYIVQGHRMDEMAGMGCFVAVYPSVLTIVLVLCFPVIITMISAVYGGETGYRFV